MQLFLLLLVFFYLVYLLFQQPAVNMPLRYDPRADSSAAEVFDLCGEESEPAAGDDNEAPLATGSAHGGPALFLISDGAAERRKEAATERRSERARA